jgi:hypothetical protein
VENLEKGDSMPVEIYWLEQVIAANLSWNRSLIKFLARFLCILSDCLSAGFQLKLSLLPAVVCACGQNQSDAGGN